MDNLRTGSKDVALEKTCALESKLRECLKNLQPLTRGLEVSQQETESERGALSEILDLMELLEKQLRDYRKLDLNACDDATKANKWRNVENTRKEVFETTMARMSRVVFSKDVFKEIAGFASDRSMTWLPQNSQNGHTEGRTSSNGRGPSREEKGKGISQQYSQQSPRAHRSRGQHAYSSANGMSQLADGSLMDGQELLPRPSSTHHMHASLSSLPKRLREEKGLEPGSHDAPAHPSEHRSGGFSGELPGDHRAQAPDAGGGFIRPNGIMHKPPPPVSDSYPSEPAGRGDPLGGVPAARPPAPQRMPSMPGRFGPHEGDFDGALAEIQPESAPGDPGPPPGALANGGGPSSSSMYQPYGGQGSMPQPRGHLHGVGVGGRRGGYGVGRVSPPRVPQSESDGVITRSEQEEGARRAEEVLQEFHRKRELPGGPAHWMGPVLPAMDATAGLGTINANSRYQLDPEFGGRVRVNRDAATPALGTGDVPAGPPAATGAAHLRVSASSIHGTVAPYGDALRDPLLLAGGPVRDSVNNQGSRPAKYGSPGLVRPSMWSSPAGVPGRLPAYSGDVARQLGHSSGNYDDGPGFFARLGHTVNGTATMLVKTAMIAAGVTGAVLVFTGDSSTSSGAGSPSRRRRRKQAQLPQQLQHGSGNGIAAAQGPGSMGLSAGGSGASASQFGNMDMPPPPASSDKQDRNPNTPAGRPWWLPSAASAKAGSKAQGTAAEHNQTAVVDTKKLPSSSQEGGVRSTDSSVGGRFWLSTAAGAGAGEGGAASGDSKWTGQSKRVTKRGGVNHRAAQDPMQAIQRPTVPVMPPPDINMAKG